MPSCMTFLIKLSMLYTGVQFIALITSLVLCELSGNLEEIQKLSAESDFDVNETSKYNVRELL